MKYIAIIDSEDELLEETVKDLKNTLFLGDEHAMYCFEIISIKKAPDPRVDALSRMRLEEAIKHAEEVAVKNEKKAGNFWRKEGNPNYEKACKCAAEHWQLAGWLKELKERREQQDEKSQ